MSYTVQIRLRPFKLIKILIKIICIEYNYSHRETNRKIIDEIRNALKIHLH